MMILRIDRALIGAAGGSRRHLLVDVTAPESPAREGRGPVNVALVLDRSGSMAGAKLRLARAAALQAIQMLRPEDRFSVVVYDDIEIFVGVPDGAIAEVYAGRARREALEVNRVRDHGQARQVLTEAAARIRRYAGDDPAMHDICTKLEREASEFGRRMDALSMKRHHFDSHKTLTIRGGDGQARKKAL